ESAGDAAERHPAAARVQPAGSRPGARRWTAGGGLTPCPPLRNAERGDERRTAERRREGEGGEPRAARASRGGARRRRRPFLRRGRSAPQVPRDVPAGRTPPAARAP